MAVTVRMNNNELYTAGDINQIGSTNGPIYWENSKSDYFVPKSIREFMVDSGYTAPTVTFTQQYLDLVNSRDAATIEAFNTQYYWSIGDIQTGGICFAVGGNALEKIYINRVDCSTVEANKWVINQECRQEVYVVHPDGTQTLEDVKLYLIDTHYVNGSPRSHDAFGLWLMQTPSNGFHIYTGWKIDDIGDTVLVSDAFSGLDKVTLNSDNNFPLLYVNRKYGYLDNQTTGGTTRYINWYAELPEFQPDPNSDGGYSDPAGGGGQFDDTSDVIPIPELPPDMLINSGIVKMYTPSSQNVKDFLNFLYTAPDQVIENLKKLWVNPFDSIISFGTVPFKVTSARSETVKFCGVSTGVTMPVLQSQFLKVNCGVYQFDKYWNSALDHNSYTKVKLFLPFIGFVPMNADELVGGTVTIEYNCDLFTGDCMAFVHVVKNDLFDIDYDGCIYSFKGNIFTQAPLSGSDYTGMYGSILNAVTAVALPSPASIAGIAKEVLGQKVDVHHSNGMSANAGTLGEYNPYFIIERPIQSLPANFIKFNGYPCNINYILKSLHGYTEVETGTFYTDSIDYITDEEAQELVDMLDKGVVLP